MKFQRLAIALIFHSYLLISGTSVIPREPKGIYEEDGFQLRFVSTVFRHGDRTIDRTQLESYPNDPYKHEDFYPFGDGQLTNVGKKRAYQLGETLRNRYSGFLGNVYYLPNVYARSTWMTRTKMTLQLVLAALYPPVAIQKWHSDLLWQPTDSIYVPSEKDDLLYPFMCPVYIKISNELLENPEIKEKIEKFHDLMNISSKYTGQNINSLVGLLILYNTLYAESLMNLTLPEWTREIYPGKLSEATLLFLELLSYEKLNNLNGGVLLTQVINDMNSVINGTLKERKINLFSAHDMNVAGMLYALNITERHLPAFTSTVIIELYEKNNTYFVKVLYYLGIPSTMVEITIPGCDILCPYDKFVELESSKAFKQPCHSIDMKTDEPYTLFATFNNPPEN